MHWAEHGEPLSLQDILREMCVYKGQFQAHAEAT